MPRGVAVLAAGEGEDHAVGGPRACPWSTSSRR